MELHVFNGVTGAHITRIPFTNHSWSDSINEEGTSTVTVPGTRESLANIAMPYARILATIEYGRILHAGYIYHARYSKEKKEWTLDAGGGATIFNKRLVMGRNLISGWRDGTVTIDEDHPSGDWQLRLTGSYSDILSKLISETLAWGKLPIIPASLKGGNREMKYNSYELRPLSEAVRSLGELDDGIEYRFDPQISTSSVLTFIQKSSSDGGEIIDNKWTWNATLPDSGVILSDEDIDGDEMCTASYGTGGRESDELLVAHATSSKLISAGYPVMQTANTSHSDVSDLSTLRSFVASDVRCGDNPQRTVGLKVDLSRYAIHIGDWVELRHDRGTNDVLSLKITDISATNSSSMATVQLRERD